MFRHRNELPVEGRMPAFDGATAWLNGGPLTPAELRGRVVLVSFGTYTCINWLRSLPYVRAWADKYAGHGLAVVGVQTPEFDFEADVDTAGRAIEEMDVRYPVVVDNDYAVWRAFDNHYWPALYFVDAEGRIRHHHFGEGEYEGSEMVLQMLLREAGAEVEQGLVRLEPTGVEAPADWASLGSPESYVGYGRAAGFASPGGIVPDERHVYLPPDSLRRNEWALSGTWKLGVEPALVAEPGGTLSYRFHARDLHLVMGPPPGHPPVRFRVRLDGEAPGPAHGDDIDESGAGTADYQRIHQLIRQPAPVGDRLFEIELLDAGVEAFVFTFG
ncbi:MAG TPA: redoxin domain-containing protein [Acidimicrobiales bacterium]|jgi:thiol-disulfide isomerase/thioredoxin|nr:redoxin domain-containing protein [Acidimicrobiales bacterium]